MLLFPLARPGPRSSQPLPRRRLRCLRPAAADRHERPLLLGRDYYPYTTLLFKKFPRIRNLCRPSPVCQAQLLRRRLPLSLEVPAGNFRKSPPSSAHGGNRSIHHFSAPRRGCVRDSESPSRRDQNVGLHLSRRNGANGGPDSLHSRTLSNLILIVVGRCRPEKRRDHFSAGSHPLPVRSITFDVGRVETIHAGQRTKSLDFSHLET
jgi:hypothetical protein